MSENTGPSAPAPSQPGGITISGKTMAYALALLLGGGAAGGGVSFASGPSKEDFAGLKNSVETVAVTAVEIKAELANARKERRDLEGDLEKAEHKAEKLEERVRALEQE